MGVAQLVEPQVVALVVVGSSPITHPIYKFKTEQGKSARLFAYGSTQKFFPGIIFNFKLTQQSDSVFCPLPAAAKPSGEDGSSELCLPFKHAPVAQLDRAPDFESVGRPFESGRAYQLFQRVSQFWLTLFCVKIGNCARNCAHL